MPTNSIESKIEILVCCTFLTIMYDILTTLDSFGADLVLKDKIFVYDVAGQRIGWTDYDCKFHQHFIADT